MTNTSSAMTPEEETTTIFSDWANSTSAGYVGTTFKPPDTSHIKYITLASYLATLAFGLAGNALVLYVIARYRNVRKKSVANYYIWNLALADELYIITIPFFCVATFSSEWIFGDVMCRVTTVLRECNKFASVFTLVALTVDRFLATYHNLGRFRTIKVGKTVCLVIWACCLVSCTPYWMYSYTVETRAGRVSCVMNWPGTREQQVMAMGVWTYTQLVIGYILPLCLIITFNALLLWRLSGLQKPGGSRGAEKSARNNASMTRTVVTIVAIFLTCQAPYYVMQIISLKVREGNIIPTTTATLVFVHFNMVAQILVFISSSCNPIIYGILNKNYRQLYKNVLTCGHFSQQATRYQTTDADDRNQVEMVPLSVSSTRANKRFLVNRSSNILSDDKFSLRDDGKICNLNGDAPPGGDCDIE